MEIENEEHVEYSDDNALDRGYNSHRRFKKYKSLLTMLLIFLILIASSFTYYIHWSLQPVKSGETVIVEISQGKSSSEIGERLEEEGVIRSSFGFKVLTLYKDYGGMYQAGTYELNTNMTPFKIVDIIRLGDTIDDSSRFTVPEGLRADQTAKILAENGLGEKERFLELFNSPGKFDYWFLDNISEDDTSKIDAVNNNEAPDMFLLEGFLYPETYQIREKASEVEIVKRMLSQFDRVFDDDFKQRKEELGLNVVEIITIASIIEREAMIDDERKKIAGVFYNRLENNRRLEACSTVEYVLQENKPRLSWEDTEIDSVYNTYLHKGLPPGPIASPGEKSIKASLYPQEHDYFYFLSKEDGSGEHIFSKTLDEHNRAKYRIRK